LGSAAIAAAKAIGYVGAGTVEFILDSSGEFFFLEVNTRLQVEHPVTEMVTGLDLVAEQLRIAVGAAPTFGDGPPPTPRGHAIELRVYAEDPVRFLPRPGRITRWEEPSGPGIRVDAGYAAGTTVTPFYDPLLAKLCAWADDRAGALERLRVAAAAFRIEGPKVNLPFFADLLADPGFVRGAYDTGIVGRLRPG
jgi:acetyl-CoA carboxylase biotin carboxylase subunit